MCQEFENAAKDSKLSRCNRSDMWNELGLASVVTYLDHMFLQHRFTILWARANFFNLAFHKTWRRQMHL